MKIYIYENTIIYFNDTLSSIGNGMGISEDIFHEISSMGYMEELFKEIQYVLVIVYRKISVCYRVYSIIVGYRNANRFNIIIIMDVELTPKRVKRTIREIARLSNCIYESDCVDCMHSLAHMINMLSAVLAEKKTIKEFLEHIAESNAGPKVIQWYLDMYEV
jgi:hypothetical protein